MDATSNGTAELWRGRIVAQQSSNQTIRGWCKDNGCHEHAFYWWRARLNLSPAKRRRAVKPVAFTEVVVNRPVESIRLTLIGGRELHLPTAMSVESVAKLIRAIEVSS